MEDSKLDKILYDAKTLANLLCISRRTLWRLIASGKFPKPIKFNRKLVRWDRRDVEDYINSIK